MEREIPLPLRTCPRCGSPDVKVNITENVRGSIKEAGTPRVYSKGSIYDVTCDACGFQQAIPDPNLNNYSATPPD